MDDARIAPGYQLARGVARALGEMGFTTLLEYPVARGLRVDVLALGPKGQVWIVECKSGLADFRADRKWQDYLPWCDRFFWAVDTDFPQHVLPDGHGLFLADAYGAALTHDARETALPAARRRAILLGVARCAMRRLRAHQDPQAHLL